MPRVIYGERPFLYPLCALVKRRRSCPSQTPLHGVFDYTTFLVQTAPLMTSCIFKNTSVSTFIYWYTFGTILDTNFYILYFGRISYSYVYVAANHKDRRLNMSYITVQMVILMNRPAWFSRMFNTLHLFTHWGLLSVLLSMLPVQPPN